MKIPHFLSSPERLALCDHKCAVIGWGFLQLLSIILFGTCQYVFRMRDHCSESQVFGTVAITRLGLKLLRLYVSPVLVFLH